MKSNTPIRAIAVLLLVTLAWYLPWLVGSLNWKYPVVALPFLAANLLTATLTLLTVFNNWSMLSLTLKKIAEGEEQDHAVIIPLVNEPVDMIRKTIESVLAQNWPHEKLIMIVSDDGGGRSEVSAMVAELQRDCPDVRLLYFRPPGRDDLRRQGKAKDGNLNAAYHLVRRRFPSVFTVETRDCDDTAPDANFLRYALHPLYQGDHVGAVQTMKDAVVSENDPFNNRERIFYDTVQKRRGRQNQAFNCGSGVVYSPKALDDIGGFSTEGIVEDLNTGLRLLQNGWKIPYVPIIGAFGQIAPENLRDMIKQRGTWALDAMLMFWWRNPLFQSGLSLRQRLSFLELGLFYLHSYAVIIYILTAIVSLLFGTYPLVTDHTTYAVHFWPYAGAIELFLVVLASGLPFESLWRSRQMWFGLAPVYAKATMMALFSGPHNKPAYKVTPKVQTYAFYWKEVWFHFVLLVLAIFAIVTNVVQHKTLLTSADPGSIYWLVFMMIAFAYIVKLSWFGVTLEREEEHEEISVSAGRLDGASAFVYDISTNINTGD